MPKVIAILYPGVIGRAASEEKEQTLLVGEGTTVKKLQLLLHVAPGTAIILIDKQVAGEEHLLDEGDVVEFHPVFSGG